MTVLLIAGTVVILGGLAAIGFGIPVKEFGFGNTLILTGTVGACTGLIMISMALAVRELKKLTLQAGEVGASLGSRPSRRDLPLSPVEEADEAEEEATPVKDAPLFSRDQPARPTGPEPGVPPWQDEVLRDRERLAAAAAAETAAADEPKRRNLLFSSSRRERERAEAAGAVPQVAVPHESGSPAAEVEVAQPHNFEDAWPRTERPRSDAIRRAARAPSAFSDKLPDASLIPDRYEPPAEEPKVPDVTVLKSGVVDGMAYSLYSDGSIEAQMPEGKMHFASIDELREHLDNRG
jgi:hypothetical protein